MIWSQARQNHNIKNLLILRAVLQFGICSAQLAHRELGEYFCVCVMKTVIIYTSVCM